MDRNPTTFRFYSREFPGSAIFIRTTTGHPTSSVWVNWNNSRACTYFCGRAPPTEAQFNKSASRHPDEVLAEVLEILGVLEACLDATTWQTLVRLVTDLMLLKPVDWFNHKEPLMF